MRVHRRWQPRLAPTSPPLPSGKPNPLAKPALATTELSCGYDATPVISGLNVSIDEGERVALLGPNGSGKSTLLKTLARLLKPLSGSVEINGRQLSRYSVREIAQAIAFIPQEENAPFGFSVAQFVTMGRLAFGNGIFDTQEDIQIAEQAMKEAECTHLSHRNIMELSGGERQRVLIARAIAQQSMIWLMDEPTAHLDIPHQIHAARMIRKLSAANTVLAAIHDLNQASVIADRALLLSEGKLVKDGLLEQILAGSEIEEVFKVKFDRLKTPGGRTVLAPHMPI